MGRGPEPEAATSRLGLLKAGIGGTEEEEDGRGEAETRTGEGVFIETSFAVSGGLEGLGRGCGGETPSSGGLGALWSTRVFTEVREGVVAGGLRGWVESTSVSLTAEREEAGLWGGTRVCFWSATSSSMCSTRPAGKEKRGEAGAWDRAGKGGVVEEGTAGRGVPEEEEEEIPAGSSREPREEGYRTDT